MQSRPLNPYFNMSAIRTPDMFFGRTDLLRRFYSAIANRQSVSIVGSRHIGKSSFLVCAAQLEIWERFDFDLSRHIFVYIDLREYLDKTSRDFFQAVSRSILKHCPPSMDIQLPSLEDGKETFRFLLEQILGQDFFPVLLMDAFDNITMNPHFNPEFFGFLRSQGSLGKISYVTATVAPLAEICHKEIQGSPFFNIFYNYTLGSLAPGEAWDLVTTPSEKSGLPFTEEEKAWLLQIAGRHPFFIQRACYALFEEKLAQSHKSPKEIKKLIYHDLQPHFQDTWDRLSEKERSRLQDEAQQKVKEERELPELSESALFRQFVRNTCRASLFKMTAEELEHALDKLDDFRALGETNLRLLNLVTRRFTANEYPLSVEKGLVIRAVLTEAFERMRGTAPRSDNDPALQSYNILYYRYFKHRMKNEQLAARFSISPRQYFRYRNRAIEELLNILLEMEDASSIVVDE